MSPCQHATTHNCLLCSACTGRCLARHQGSVKLRAQRSRWCRRPAVAEALCRVAAHCAGYPHPGPCLHAWSRGKSSPSVCVRCPDGALPSAPGPALAHTPCATTIQPRLRRQILSKNQKRRIDYPIDAVVTILRKVRFSAQLTSQERHRIDDLVHALLTNTLYSPDLKKVLARMSDDSQVPAWVRSNFHSKPEVHKRDHSRDSCFRQALNSRSSLASKTIPTPTPGSRLSDPSSWRRHKSLATVATAADV